MSILLDKTSKVINCKSIFKGCLVNAMHKTWNKPKNGIVTEVTDSEIRVQFIQDVGNLTNYFIITVEKILNDEWKLRWSSDLIIVETNIEEIVE